jgi:predicted nucleotidyltransferase
MIDLVCNGIPNMNNEKNRTEILEILKRVMEKDQEVLFAYLYGSYVYNSDDFKSDIDVAVYLKPSDIKGYIKKEEELTINVVTKIHKDRIDLRILNVLPLLLQYNILKEGIPIFVRDERERVDFETRVMNRFFELKPYIDEYQQMSLLKIKAGI